MNPFPPLLIAAFALSALSPGSCAEKDKEISSASPAPAEVTPPAPDAAARWTNLRNYPFEQRDQLLAALKPLVAQVDEQINALKAKRAVMVQNSVDTANWDFAMKEMNDARSYLTGAAGELGRAGRENWDPLKNRFGRAWLRTQEAYAKVCSSTTT